MFLGDPEFLMGCLTRCVEDPFDKESNKEGFVNLGTAVNSLCEDIIKERLDKVVADDNSDKIFTECSRGTCSGTRPHGSTTWGSMGHRSCSVLLHSSYLIGLHR